MDMEWVDFLFSVADIFTRRHVFQYLLARYQFFMPCFWLDVEFNPFPVRPVFMM
jgi:hypothetical protein